MLTIRPEQLHVFERAMDADFEARLARALRARQPALDKISDEELGDRIRAAIARARGYGFVGEATIADFVGLAFSVSPRFDEHPPIRAMLRDHCMPLEQRVRWLIAELPVAEWEIARRLRLRETRYMHWHVCLTPGCDFETFDVELDHGKRCVFCEQPMFYRGTTAMDGVPENLLPLPPRVAVVSAPPRSSTSDGEGDAPMRLSDEGKFSSGSPATRTGCKPPEGKEEAVRLLAVEILDGDNGATDGARQWVNLPKNGTWRDRLTLTNTDRLGNEVRARLTFNKAGPVAVQLAVDGKDPEGLNLAYTRDEEGRNPRRFKVTAPDSLTNPALDGKFQHTLDLRLAGAGGRGYVVRARDANGNEAASTRVVIWRKLYYRVIAMSGVTVPDLGPIREQLAARFIDFVPACDTRTIPGFYQGNEAATDRMVAALPGGPDVSGFRPHLLTILFMWDYVKRVKVKVSFPITMPKKSDEKALVTRHWKTADVRFLWHGVFRGISDKRWLAEAFMVKWGDAVEDEKNHIKISRKLFTPAREEGDPEGEYRSLSVDKVAIMKKTGAIPEQKYLCNFEAAVAESSYLGLGPPDTDLIMIAARAGGKTLTAEQMRVVLTHEIGHKLGMVPDGSDGKGTEPKSRARLDAPGTQYTGGDHQGSHCKGKLRGSATACVMYGSVDFEKGTSLAFCPACVVALHKLDWRGWVAHPAAPNADLFAD